MSELSVTLHWQRSEPALRPREFSSAHTVRYNEEMEVAVDTAQEWGGGAAKTNPEQVKLRSDAIDAWVAKGAQLSPTVKSLMRRVGRQAA